MLQTAQARPNYVLQLDVQAQERICDIPVMWIIPKMVRMHNLFISLRTFCKCIKSGHYNAQWAWICEISAFCSQKISSYYVANITSRITFKHQVKS